MSQPLDRAPTARRRRSMRVVALLVLALFAAILYRAPSAHAATAAKVVPAVVPQDAGVAITGEGLAETTGVTFLGNPGAGDDVRAEHFIVVDAKKVVAQLPAGARSGPVAITSPAGVVDTGAAHVTIVPPPAIAAVSARAGQPGDVITITGEHLTGSKKPTVTFGAKAGGVTAMAPGELKVKVPAGLRGGPVTLRITTDGGRADTAFYIAPTVKAVAPKAGSSLGGTVATITGSGFSGVDGVTIGGERVTRLVAVSDTEIVAEAPAGTSPAAPVIVSTTDDDVVASSTAGPLFEYQPIPVITSVSPSWNQVSTEGEPARVVLQGRNFTPTTVLTLGSTVISDAVVDAGAGTITFTPPASAKPAVAKLTVTNLNEAGKAFTATSTFAYVAAPVVTKVAPVSAPVGSPVTVSGTGFIPGATVKFGSNDATCTVASFVALQCVAPAGAGLTDVTVTTSLGTSASTAKSAFTYVAGDAPAPVPPLDASVTGVTPVYGTTGTVVALKGANLHLLSRVDFTGTDSAWVNAPNFLVAGPGRLVVTVPGGAASGPLRLTTPNGRTTGGAYISSVRPSVSSIDVVGDAIYGATGGDMLVIKGNGLVVGPVRPVVTIGGKPAAVLGRPVPNPRTIVVKVPAHLGGREDVVVTTPLGTATSEATVYFVPQVKAVKPATTSRAGGVVATVTGTGFRGADAVTLGAGRPSAVTFGGTPATRMVVMSDKEIIAVTAAGSASAEPILVKTESNGWTGFSDDRARPNSSPVPAITLLDPNVMTLGMTPPPVTITGTNLREDSTVLFGTQEATVQSAAADGRSMVVVPPVRTTTSTVPVTVINVALGEELTATFTGGFSYLPVPSVSSFSPSSGFTGAAPPAVTLTGANLRLDSVVKFGTATATVQSVNSGGTSLVVAPPVNNTAGAVPVTVTNILDGGEQLTFTAAGSYRYELAVATITGKSHTTALPGTTVTITGTSFVNVTSVRLGATTVAATVANPTTIFVTIPVTPSGLQGQTVDISVVNGTGQPSTGEPATADDWTWSSHPIVTGMTPRTGAQGSTVTLTGSGFTGATAVRFGSINVAAVVVNDTTVTATVPVTPSAGSVVDVAVVARDLTSPEPLNATVNDWTWSPIAVISGVTAGASGTNSTVTGMHFTGTRKVVLTNGVTTYEPSFTVGSNTGLTFVTPTKPNKANQTAWVVHVVNQSGANSVPTTTGANAFVWP